MQPVQQFPRFHRKVKKQTLCDKGRRGGRGYEGKREIPLCQSTGRRDLAYRFGWSFLPTFKAIYGSSVPSTSVMLVPIQQARGSIDV